MPIWIMLALAALLIISILYYVRFYRRHMLGEHAPEQKIEVEVLDKQSVAMEYAQPGEENEEYWLYVQPRSGGLRREFKIGIHYYHALNSGDRGILTYQGTTFLHFALQRD
ncbi:DUF2500 domain-containing protein [uncultured Photobacterium sp.]|uniref:DUF2500 domain-containing protein n=1 Tax=uncultured Photobacterium sp. TaxID=173973 RepID=UPI002618EC66|nr:DUF2500 domain-containing protein [uncultured Photobacterium sp.]